MTTSHRPSHRRRPFRSLVQLGLACLLPLSLVACAPPEEEESAPVDEPSAFENAEQSLSIQESLKKKLPPEVMKIAGMAGEVAGLFSQVSGYLDAARTIGEMLGFLEGDPGLGPEFDKLHDHLDQVAGSIAWQNAALDDSKRRDIMRSAVTRAADAVELGQRVTTTVDESSDVATRQSAAEVAFLRYYRDSDTDGLWRNAIADRPPVNAANFVYDWRLGLPSLMMITSLRLSVMAAAHPDFRKGYKRELDDMRTALREHAVKMVHGLKCGTNVTKNNRFAGAFEHKEPDLSVLVACADIYTGISETKQFYLKGSEYDPTDCPCYKPAAFTCPDARRDQAACAEKKRQTKANFDQAVTDAQFPMYERLFLAIPIHKAMELADKL